MKTAYIATSNGFELTLDLSLYARPAVMKALYCLSDAYSIAYERKGKRLHIYLTDAESAHADYSSEAAKALRLIQFEMLRYDTMRRTSHVRTLLVGRALYASCVEKDPPPARDGSGAAGGSWRDDAQQIFESWNPAQAKCPGE